VNFFSKIVLMIKSRTTIWVGLVANKGERGLQALWVIESNIKTDI
jgi:hypothetical protein